MLALTLASTLVVAILVTREINLIRYQLGLLLVPLILMLNSVPSTAFAAQIRVAVASNFTSAAKMLQLEFEQQSQHTLSLSFGSTGKHYAQIRNGAPFDIFLAADAERPERLQREGFAVSDNRFTYALGKLVLWSSALPDLSEETLSTTDFRHLAIANPELAPYGQAATQVLDRLGLSANLQERLAFADNVGQAFAFVHTGNAELGFIAQSQLVAQKLVDKELSGSFWKVPEDYYDPIEQQAILLSDKPAAAEFLLFLMDERAKTIIANAGFKLP